MRRVAAVFAAFLGLGVTSFGGPVAHLGYFHQAFVVRRRWESEHSYGELLALCQFLPGPASSQVGFAIGLRRAGFVGAVAAFLAFTLPSAALMVLAAASVETVSGPIAEGVVHGLTVVAVAVVAHAVWGMTRSLTPDRPRATIAVLAAGAALLASGGAGQIGAIVLGAAAGMLWCRPDRDPTAETPVRAPVSRGLGVTSLALFVALLVALPVVAAATGSGAVAVADAFYRAGALVFGGGHVVLPLLQSAVVDAGWVSPADFVAGYGAAQALPGPLFAFAAYLGALVEVGPGGVAGAAIALVAVFLPGFLLLIAALPFWAALRSRPWSAGLVRGANAAVVGILAAALYDPVFVTAIGDAGDLVLALVCFGALSVWRAPAWTVVLAGAAVGAVSGILAA